MIHICETCYRDTHYGTDSFVKVCKHSILEDGIHPAASRNICRCSDVPHFDPTGRSRALFPVDELADRHIDVNGLGSLQCGLLKLGDLVADAKYDAMQQNIAPNQKSKKLSQIRRLDEIKEDKNDKKREKHRRRLRTTTPQNILNDANRTQSGGTQVPDEIEADADIPFFFRKYAERHPFGNVHMAIRLGPLIIENGVAQ